MGHEKHPAMWQRLKGFRSPMRVALSGFIVMVLFGLLGSLSNLTIVGGCIGFVTGSVIGWLRVTSQIGTAIYFILWFATAGAFFGPTVDADALPSALCFAVVGAWFGFLRLHGILSYFGIFLGFCGGALLSPIGAFLGSVFGFFIGWKTASLLVARGIYRD